MFGLSRDDSASFLGAYQRLGIFEHDPFVTLDTEGVGELVRIAAERGRAARPGLKLGICGEHGGDPASIRFFQEVGLDYVSCSPYRVPIARLAAAQAALVWRASGRDGLMRRAAAFALLRSSPDRRCLADAVSRRRCRSCCRNPLPAPAPPHTGAAAAADQSRLRRDTAERACRRSLTQPGPVYQLPQPASPAYPPQQLPGPIDQQKLQAYRNSLRAQQWQLQQQGVSPGSERSREIQQQLNAPDPQ